MASPQRAQPEPLAAERVPARAPDRRMPERVPRVERRVTVPIVDEYEPGRVIYQPRMTRLALAGALAGGLILGWIAWMVAAGPWAVAGLGQFAASGTTVATFTGAGVGVAAGGLAGALAALYGMPARRPGEHSGRARGRGKENER